VAAKELADEAKEPAPGRTEKPRLMADGARTPQRPLLMVDIDGVISLFGFAGQSSWTGRTGPGDGSFHTIDGIPHFLSRAAAAHLLGLATEFELVWASGWEEKAEEYLPRLLELPAGLPFIEFERTEGAGRSLDGHWKLDAIESYAGARALAWIDDAFNDACHAWAATRPAPTLLVQTTPAHGLTSAQAQQLTTWAQSLVRASAGLGVRGTGTD
jgi:HAD domain in Swiss Army Knife RNA repair proteins